MIPTEFRPLNWLGPITPDEQRRSRYTFKVPWSQTLSLLNRELGYLDAEDLVIEADFRSQDIRLDGWPRSNARVPQFPGVRIMFHTEALGRLIYQTDTCVWWQHNVRSIALGLESLRAVDRYGITARSQQYTGFRELEARAVPTFASADEALKWIYSEEALGIVGGDGLTPKSARRLAGKHCHPDTGGNRELWAKFEAATKLLEGAGVL